jgi:hypothetical protein
MSRRRCRLPLVVGAAPRRAPRNSSRCSTAIRDREQVRAVDPGRRAALEPALKNGSTSAAGDRRRAALRRWSTLDREQELSRATSPRSTCGCPTA